MRSIETATSLLQQIVYKNTPYYRLSHIQEALNSIKNIDLKTCDTIGMLIYKHFNDKGFEIWQQWFKDTFNSSQDQNFKRETWQATTPKLTLDVIFKFAARTKYYKQPTNLKPEFIDWLYALDKSILSGQQYTILDQNIFEKIKNQPFSHVLDLNFQPQCTFQYPIEHSIPLWFGLFGFTNKLFTTLKNSLPFYDIKSSNDFLNYSELTSKELGFAFLYAQTILHLVPNTRQDHDLMNALEERMINGQVDAKGLLNLLCRRPFSRIWSDIKSYSNTYSSFLELFNQAYVQNNKFFKNHVEHEQAQEQSFLPFFCLNQMNYGEQYLLLDRSNVLDLTDVFTSDSFNEKFYRDCKEQITKFLKRGIVSTTMIRNLKLMNENNEYYTKEDIQKLFEQYYFSTQKSIDAPNEIQRYDLNVDSRTIISTTTEYDTLSPPWFLDQDDAMGFYKDDSQIDKTYGEAIIEARMIKQVGPFFRQMVAIEDKQADKFLVQPLQLIEEAQQLFLFVESLMKKQYSKQILQKLNVLFGNN